MSGFGVDNRVQFKQSFIHAAEFFGAEVFIIHRAQAVFIADEGQRANRFQQIVIRNFAIVQGSDGFVREQEAAQRRQAEFVASAIPQLLHHQPQAVIQIAVTCANAPFCQLAQARNRIKARVPLAHLFISSGRKQ